MSSVASWGGLRFLCVDDETAGLRTHRQSLLAAGVPEASIVTVLVSRTDAGGEADYQLPPSSLEDVGAAIAAIYCRRRCSVALVDLQLKVENVEALREGADVTRALYGVGLRYAVWLTNYAMEVERNPRELVTGQVGPRGQKVPQLDCPRALLVDKARGTDRLPVALRFLQEQMTTALRAAEHEWSLEAYQLERLYRKLKMGTDSIKHGLERATPEEIADLEAFELVPYSDPPSPLGMWLNAASPAAPSAVREAQSTGQCAALELWFQHHLFGLPSDLLEEFVRRVAQRYNLEGLSPNVTYSIATDAVVGCVSRRTLGDVIGTLLKNADEHGTAGAAPVLRITDWQEEGRPVVATIALSNPVTDEDMSSFMEAAQGRRMAGRGLRNVCEAIDDLNRLAETAMESEATGWSYQLHLWRAGRCQSEDGVWVEAAKPGEWYDGRFFRRGHPPATVANAAAPFYGALVPQTGCCVTVTIAAPLLPRV